MIPAVNGSGSNVELELSSTARLVVPMTPMESVLLALRLVKQAAGVFRENCDGERVALEACAALERLGLYMPKEVLMPLEPQREGVQPPVANAALVGAGGNVQAGAMTPAEQEDAKRTAERLAAAERRIDDLERWCNEFVAAVVMANDALETYLEFKVAAGGPP